jgi:hypothetical protein
MLIEALVQLADAGAGFMALMLRRQHFVHRTLHIGKRGCLTGIQLVLDGLLDHARLLLFRIAHEARFVDLLAGEANVFEPA